MRPCRTLYLVPNLIHIVYAISVCIPFTFAAFHIRYVDASSQVTTSSFHCDKSLLQQQHFLFVSNLFA